MELDVQTIMMGVFILALIVSLWKIKPFFSNTPLYDDDTTPEAQAKLLKITLKHLGEADNKTNTKKLLEAIKKDEEFDQKHFWRFNENKLIHLLDKLDQQKN